MRKTILTGILAASLIAGGGIGIISAQAKDNPDTAGKAKQAQGMDMNQMREMMKSGNMGNMQNMMEQGNMGDMQEMMKDGVMNFGQMKPYMKQMHPDLTDQQLEEHYKSMHGTGGSENSKNFQ